MKRQYRIDGAACTSKWVEGDILADVSGELERRYNNASRKLHMPDIMHCPGVVAGDMNHTRNGMTYMFSGARDGHGNVYVYVRNKQ